MNPRESTPRRSCTRISLARTSRRRPMPDVFRAKLASAYPSLKLIYSNSHGLWGKVIDYARELLIVREDDTKPVRTMPLEDLFPPVEDVLESELLAIEAGKECSVRQAWLEKKARERAQLTEGRKRCAELLELDTDDYFAQQAVNDPDLARRQRRRVRDTPPASPGGSGVSDNGSDGDGDGHNDANDADAFQEARPLPRPLRLLRHLRLLHPLSCHHLHLQLPSLHPF